MAKGQKGVLDRWRSSDGRVRIATLGGVSALVIAVGVLGVLPAVAGSGAPSQLGVQPTEITYGGGSGACDANFPGLPSAAQYELWINNPADGVYTGPDGTQVTLDVYSNDTEFTFNIMAANVAAYDVVVNGGSNNTHFDYDNGPGPAKTDSDLHAPTKGGSANLYKLSHINICYDVFSPNVSGVKFHDRDTDGELDVTEEETLPGWTIAVFDQSGQKVRETVTQADGSYLIGGLPAGTYTVCEATNTTGLPSNGTNFTWMWTQSAPSGNTLCAGKTGFEPAGYTIPGGTTLIEDRDFGNHTEIEIRCNGTTPISVTLGGSGTGDNPQATINVPANCTSTFTSAFDVGRSDQEGGDPDDWSQFVVFTGDPNGTVVIDELIKWDSEEAMYDGDNLIVPSTLVLLDEGGTLSAAELCNTLPGGQPQAGVSPSACLYSRTIAEGGALPQGDIQLTELYKFLGDPKSFR